MFLFTVYYLLSCILRIQEMSLHSPPPEYLSMVPSGEFFWLNFLSTFLVHKIQYCGVLGPY